MKEKWSRDYEMYYVLNLPASFSLFFYLFLAFPSSEEGFGSMVMHSLDL